MKIHFDPEDLQPVIAAIVAETLRQLQTDQGTNGRLAYSEAEAAELLGLEQHQLRDERLRGRIHASMGPGRRILYTKHDLAEYLAARRYEAPGPNGRSS